MTSVVPYDQPVAVKSVNMVESSDEVSDAVKSLVGVPISSRSNVHKIIAHFYLDYSAYYTWSPTFLLLQYFRTGNDLTTVLFMNVAYLSAGFAGTLGMAYLQVKLHQRTLIHIAVVATLLNILCLVLATVYESRALAIVAFGMTGLYFSSTSIATAAVFTDCMNAEDPEKDYNAQFIAQSLAPLTGSVVLMILFSVLGDTWTPSTMQTIIFIAVGLQLFVILLLFSLTYDHVKVAETRGAANATETNTTTTTNEEVSPTSSSSLPWVPLVALANNSCRDVVEQMMWTYFPYYAAETLGLNPTLLFGLVMSSQGAGVALILIEQQITERFLPYVRVAWLFQILIPIGNWVAFATMNGSSTALFIAAVIIHNCFREAPTGLSNGTAMRYASPKQRELLGGLGIEGFKQLGWVIGTVVGGTVGDTYGFEAIVLPTAILATFTWMQTLLLLLAPAKGAEDQEDIPTFVGARSLMAMGQLSRARDRACGSLMMAIRFKRTLLRAVRRRRAAMNQSKVEDLDGVDDGGRIIVVNPMIAPSNNPPPVISEALSDI